MRILILTTYFLPDITANGIIVGQLAQELAARGHRVTVVTTLPHYARNRIDPAYRYRFSARSRENGLDVIRLHLYVPARRSSICGRLLSYLSFNALSTAAMSLLPRHDVIFAPSPPLTNGVAAVLVGKLQRIPVVYNVQDIYPDIAIKLGVLTNPLLIELCRRMERFVYRHSATVSVISDGFRHTLLAKGVPSQKIAVIPNFVDCDAMRPGDRLNRFRSAHGLGEDDFVALFAGNIGLSQGLETVLQTARSLRDCPHIRFLIVGNGAAKRGLQETAQQMGLTNVAFLPYQPHDDVPEMYACADVGLVPLRRGIAQDSVPSKLLTLMAAGRPVIASVDAGSDAWRLVQTAHCGICVEPEQPNGTENALQFMYSNRMLAAAMGCNGRRYVECHCSLQHVAGKTLRLFRSVTSDRARLAPNQA